MLKFLELYTCESSVMALLWLCMRRCVLSVAMVSLCVSTARVLRGVGIARRSAVDGRQHRVRRRHSNQQRAARDHVRCEYLIVSTLADGQITITAALTICPIHTF